SLHDDDPSSTGRSEISGGSPAYARQAIAWDSAELGELSDSSNGIDFDVPASATVRYVGLWSASTSGTFYGYAEVPEETFGAQGVYRLTDFTIPMSDPS